MTGIYWSKEETVKLSSPFGVLISTIAWNHVKGTVKSTERYRMNYQKLATLGL